MSTLDWLILAIPALAVFWIGFRTRRYAGGVTGFLAAGRSGGRFLVSACEGAAGMGLITAVGLFEMFYQAGTAINWWNNVSTAVGIVLSLTGFVIYRYRQTRALTMAQFFEVRYSRRLRILMGVLAFVSGVVNYGIFPAVGARFFICYCDLPTTLRLAGVGISTYALLVGLFLCVGLSQVLLAGQLQVMVVDCVQTIVSGALFLVVAFAVLRMFSFEQMFDAMSHRPPGQSLLNPFDTSHLSDFNPLYVLIGVIGMVYSYMSWQGSSGVNASAASPHEARMGKVVAGWRGFAQSLMFLLLGMAAITYLRHPAFAVGATATRASLATIADESVRKSMTVPAALAHLLPVGVKGCFAAIMLFMMVSCDASYLHSWGTIFVQDVVLPLRKTPLDQRQHLSLLRWAIAGVAAFAFAFALLFRQTDYIFMFFDITGAIFVGGSGAVLLGGLYWSRGTTAGAYAAMIAGSGLAVGGIVARQVFPHFPLNGRLMWAVAMFAGVASYAVVSLLTCRAPFDMDRMLHRGPYAVEDDEPTKAAKLKFKRNWKSMMFGFDEHYTPGDKFLTGSLAVWSAFWFAAFIVITALNLFHPWSERAWWNWGLVNVWKCIILAPVTTIWFTWGGVRDLRRLFAKLRHAAENPLDDGTVIGDANADEAADAPRELEAV